jgi:hypothetical protein
VRGEIQIIHSTDVPNLNKCFEVNPNKAKFVIKILNAGFAIKCFWPSSSENPRFDPCFEIRPNKYFSQRECGIIIALNNKWLSLLDEEIHIVGVKSSQFLLTPERAIKYILNLIHFLNVQGIQKQSFFVEKLYNSLHSKKFISEYYLDRVTFSISKSKKYKLKKAKDVFGYLKHKALNSYFNSMLDIYSEIKHINALSKD